MREDFKNFDKIDDRKLELLTDNVVSKDINSTAEKMSEPDSTKILNLEQMKTWNGSLVDTSTPVPVMTVSISNTSKSMKKPLEKRSDQGPRKAVNLTKKKNNDDDDNDCSSSGKRKKLQESLSVLAPMWSSVV